MPSLIQCNLNRSWGAQDLLAQFVREEEIGICAISEPRRVPDSKKWCKSLNGLAAVMWEPRILGRPGIMVGRGENFVTAEFGDFKVISCYISPNVDMGVFLEFLDELGEEVRRLGNRETIICGDFNSTSILWGYKVGSSKLHSRWFPTFVRMRDLGVRYCVVLRRVTGNSV